MSAPLEKYIGDKKVVGITKLEVPNRVEVIFEDGSKETFSSLLVEQIQTDEPQDLTSLRDIRALPVVKALVTTLLEWDVKVSEMDFIFSMTVNNLNQKLEAADEKLWKKQLNNRTLYDVNEVLTSGSEEKS